MPEGWRNTNMGTFIFLVKAGIGCSERMLGRE
jgi:hypothetical protein